MSGDDVDLVVVGAGSGGIGAALAAARSGLRVVLLEAADEIGGTATRGGVHNWEPGVGGTSFPFEIYLALERIPDAVRVTGGLRYVDTLRRHGSARLSAAEASRFRAKHWHRVVFEPAAYRSVVERLLRETGRCEVRTSCPVDGAEVDDGLVRAVRLPDGSGLAAPAFVDATGDVVLARSCGCAVSIGQESRDAYAEPGAPSEAAPHLNGVTLVYRATPNGGEDVAHPPADLPEACSLASIRHGTGRPPADPVSHCRQCVRRGTRRGARRGRVRSSGHTPSTGLHTLLTPDTSPV